MSATVLLKDIVDALEMVSDEFLSFLDLDTGEVETVNFAARPRNAATTKSRICLPGRTKNGRSPSELSSAIASGSFPPSSKFTNGRSCGSSRIRWSPSGLARSYRTLSTAKVRSGISRTRFGGTGGWSPPGSNSVARRWRRWRATGAKRITWSGGRGGFESGRLEFVSPLNFGQAAVEGAKREMASLPGKVKDQAIGKSQTWFCTEQFQCPGHGLRVL